MGRNNLEKRGSDVNWGYNQTKKKPFKFEFLNDMQCRELEIANGLTVNEISLGIRISGVVDISMKDKLVIKGLQKLVIALKPEYDNPQQGKYKGDITAFTGNISVGLN